MKEEINILFIADIVGKPGRWAVSQLLPQLREKFKIDFTIANVENVAGGYGLTKEIAQKIYSYGVDCQTSGNHIWDRKEIYDYLEEDTHLLRPANYPPTVPGYGSTVMETIDGIKIGVLNIQGRVFIKEIDCPFRISEREVGILREQTNIIVVDLHAEATSEKIALGWFLDGKVSAVLGTHTHVQTADETILPGGTAYITDVGMTGSHDSVIGICKEDALARFTSQLPVRFKMASEDIKFCGAVVNIDTKSGKAKGITRLRIDLPKKDRINIEELDF
jgi:metallophosphoesterase (TIGR00282 family)